MRFRSRGPSEEVVSFSFTTKYNSFFCPTNSSLSKDLGRFISIHPKRPVWVFGSFLWRMEQQFPKFPKKRTTTRGIPKFSIFFTGSVLSIQLCSGIFFRIFNWIVHVSEIQQFPEFLQTFLYYLPLFPNFRKFCLNGKRPCTVFNFLQILINLTSPKSPQLRFVVNNPCSWCIDTCSKNIQSKIIMQIKPLLRATFKNW